MSHRTVLTVQRQLWACLRFRSFNHWLLVWLTGACEPIRTGQHRWWGFTAGLVSAQRRSVHWCSPLTFLSLALFFLMPLGLCEWCWYCPELLWPFAVWCTELRSDRVTLLQWHRHTGPLNMINVLPSVIETQRNGWKHSHSRL